MADLSQFAVGNADVSGLDPTFARQLNAFLAASPGIQVYSAYRSPEKQAGLWSRALDKYGSPEAARKWVAPPGRSFHGRGLASDLRFSGQEAIDWAHANAGDYGLNFPLSNENWHIELAGARGNRQPQATPPGGPSSAPPVTGASQSNDANPQPLALAAVTPGADVAQSSSLGRGPGGGLFNAENMTTDAFLHDYFSGINPIRGLVMNKLAGLFA